jgi:hypothetical protein
MKRLKISRSAALTYLAAFIIATLLAKLTYDWWTTLQTAGR